ncbi:uncharacterized protein [Dysidea avara]|uniref:uncharacterized protein isoform X2 n=1 Tax=Dysidea avara TaxID=196820 RepID=UPI0033205D40
MLRRMDSVQLLKQFSHTICYGSRPFISRLSKFHVTEIARQNHIMSTAVCQSRLLLKHQLLICCRHSSDDSTAKNENDSEKEDSFSSNDLVDFDEMLENIRKLKLEGGGDGDSKDIYVGKKKHRVRIEQRRTELMTIEELVDFLTDLNGIDICVINVNPDLNYVKYLVTVTGLSTRHLLSMAKSLAYECKHIPSLKADKGVHVEGIECEDWMVFSLGDIVVHFMLQAKRDILELEKLWSLGHRYDDQYKLLELQEDSIL